MNRALVEVLVALLPDQIGIGQFDDDAVIVHLGRAEAIRMGGDEERQRGAGDGDAGAGQRQQAITQTGKQRRPRKQDCERPERSEKHSVGPPVGESKPPSGGGRWRRTGHAVPSGRGSA